MSRESVRPTSYEGRYIEWNEKGNKRRVGSLHTCKFLQPYYGAPNPHIRLVTPLVWLIVLQTATKIAIFTD
ncbi:hypothetical protein TNCV_707181 [Trichonephila clavipes]|nr:hypothetical protein TNCV_707181 [Trichonephila clavipes]